MKNSPTTDTAALGLPDLSWMNDEEIPEQLRGGLILAYVGMLANPDHPSWKDEAEHRKLVLAAMALNQKFQADCEEIFPPDEPGSKAVPMPDAKRQAVNDMLDAAAGYDMTPETLKEMEQAYKTADAGYFRALAEAADYVQKLDYSRFKFQNTVREARRAFADLLAATGKVPKNTAVRDEVIRRLGEGTWSAEESSRWSPVYKAAGLYATKATGAKKKHGDRYSGPR